MAKFFDNNVKESIDFDEFLDLLRSFEDKVFTDDNFDKSKLALQKLFNNRSFLTSYFNSLLKDMLSQSCNLYTFQVFMLAREKHFNIRAPIWLPPQGLKSDSAFVYELPHDHNFDIMTLGYLGDGYRTDIYQYNTEKVVGYDNEPVDLFELEHFQLTPGSILFMGTNKDVHIQMPPKDLSISLNIMKTSGLTNRQFMFDLQKKQIIKKIDGEISPSFFKIAAYLGDENTIEIVEDLSLALQNRYEKNKDDCIKDILSRTEIQA
jgi:hypothetical protein